MINVNIAETPYKKRYSEKVTILYGLYNGTRMLIGAINVLFLLDRGVKLSEVAQLQMVYAVTIFILEIPTGIIADVISRKISILLSCLVLIIYYPMVYFGAPSMVILSLSQIMYGLALCLVSGAFEGWQIDIVKTEHPEDVNKINYYGHLKYEMNSFVTMFSGTLGAFLVYLNKANNYIVLYNLCAVIMIAITFGFITIPAYNDENANKACLTSRIYKDYWKQCKSSIRCIRDKEDSIYYILCIGLLCCTYQVVYYYWQPLFENLAISSKGMECFKGNTELLVGTVFFTYCISRYLFNRFVRKQTIGKINPFWIAVISMLLAVVFMITLTISVGANIWIYIMSFAIIQGTTMITEGVIEAQYIKVINKNNISSVLSFMSSIQSVLTTLILFILSKTITTVNMKNYFGSTVIIYLLIVFFLIKWRIRFGGEK